MFVYCIVPIIQDKVFSNFSDRFNDYYIFFLSSSVYGFMQMVYTNTSIPYIVQFILWLFTWWILYLIMRFVKLVRAK